jgi:hypothetical protein
MCCAVLLLCYKSLKLVPADRTVRGHEDVMSCVECVSLSCWPATRGTATAVASGKLRITGVLSVEHDIIV